MREDVSHYLVEVIHEEAIFLDHEALLVPQSELKGLQEKRIQNDFGDLLLGLLDERYIGLEEEQGNDVEIFELEIGFAVLDGGVEFLDANRNQKQTEFDKDLMIESGKHLLDKGQDFNL